MKDLLNRIKNACVKPNEDYSICAENELVPVGGEDGNKIMPPTYCGAVKGEWHYHFEDRWINKEKVGVVVLDSYASCANRLELAAYGAWEENEFPMPVVKINCPGIHENLTSLHLPHRIFSAHFKYTYVSENNQKKKFEESEFGNGLYNVDNKETMKNLFKYNPLGIILGCWRSQMDNFKLNRARAFRKPRCLVMEIIGLNPLKTQKSGGMLSLIEPADTIGDLKPSAMGLGSTPPSLGDGGVSVQYIKENFQLAIHSLFDFHTGNNEFDTSARTVLVCMVLYAHSLRGVNYSLRSNCNLRKVSDTKYKWNNKDEFSLTTAQAKELYLSSLDLVPNHGFSHNPYVLDANDDLIKILRSGYTDGNNKKKGKKEQ